jgi:hypothetical protein
MCLNTFLQKKGKETEDFSRRFLAHTSPSLQSRPRAATLDPLPEDVLLDLSGACLG